MTIEIREPIWSKKAIGIATIYATRPEQKLKIKITYKSKADGRSLYPGIYEIETKKILKYPSQLIKGTRVSIIPIADLEGPRGNSNGSQDPGPGDIFTLIGQERQSDGTFKDFTFRTVKIEFYERAKKELEQLKNEKKQL